MIVIVALALWLLAATLVVHPNGVLAAGQEFAGGAGTSDDPWLIETAEELAAVNNYLGADNSDKYFKLANDIDLAPLSLADDNKTGWQPIGQSDHPFQGHLDGDGYVIYNLWLYDKEGDDAGLFGVTDGATIQNLGVETVAGKQLTGYRKVGILVGSLLNSTLRDCYVAGAVAGASSVGGLSGYANGSEIEGCYAAGSVYATGEAELNFCHAGGLIGECFGQIRNSYAQAAVRIDSGSRALLNNLGGLCGFFEGEMTNCYATGSLSGLDNGGNNRIGGLVGCSYGIFNNCYFDRNTTGQSLGKGQANDDGGVSAKSTDSMKSRRTYKNWDFKGSAETPAVWFIRDGDDYPLLRWQVYDSGSGSAEDAYLISTPQQLDHLRQYTGKAGRNTYFALTDDIDLTNYLLNGANMTNRHATTGWVPIGNVEDGPFYGTLDGAGYEVDGLWIEREESNVGLFGGVGEGGAVLNMGVNIDNENGGVQGVAFVGGLVGSLRGTVENCYVNGNVSGTSVIGGLVGQQNGIGATRRSYATGNIDGRYMVGGLIGRAYGAIADCYAQGDVSGISAIGGLVGNNNCDIQNSYAEGDVFGEGNLGSLIGINTDGEAATCYAVGRVTKIQVEDRAEVDGGEAVGIANIAGTLNSEFSSRGRLIEVPTTAILSTVYDISGVTLEVAGAAGSLSDPYYYEIDDAATPITLTATVEPAADEQVSYHYNWTFATENGKPAGSSYVRPYSDESNPAMATLTPDVPGTYIVVLTVTTVTAGDDEVAESSYKVAATIHAFDRSALQTAYNEGAALAASDYTATSWVFLDEALTAADDILTQEAPIDQRNIDNAAQVLRAARMNLIEAPLTGLDVYLYDDLAHEYTGSAMTPGFRVYNANSEPLDEDTDYEYSFSNNLNVSQGGNFAKLTVTGVNDYEGLSRVVNFVIVPKPLTADLIKEVPTATYNGEPRTPQVTAEETPDVSLEKGDDFELVYDAMIDAGFYTFTVRGIGNYTGSVTCDFEIKRANGELTVTCDDVPFGGTPQPTFTSNNPRAEVTYQYKEAGAGDDQYSTTVPTAVGRYTVQGLMAISDNYEAATATADFAITQEQVDGTLVVTCENVTVGTAPQPQYESNNPDAVVTFSYKVRGADDDTYSETAPTEIGNYTVRGVMAESSGYTGATATANFSIQDVKQTGELTVTCDDVPVGTAPHPQYESNNPAAVVNFVYKEQGAADDTYNETAPTAIGLYTVKGTMAESEQYTAASATADFAIYEGKIPGVITVTCDDVPVGAAPAPQVSHNNDDTEATVVLEYKLRGEADTAYSATAPTAAGEYTVRASMVETEHYTAASATADFAIMAERVTGILTVTCSDVPVGSQPHPQYESNNPQAVVTFQYKVRGAADITYTDEAPTSVGLYTVRGVMAETEQYTAASATADFAIVDSQVTGTLTVTCENVSFGAAPHPQYESNDPDAAVTFHYKVRGAADSTYSATVPTAVGDYTVKGTKAESAGYTAAEATADFSIVRKSIVDCTMGGLKTIMPHTGSAVTQDNLYIYNGAILLVEGTDYTVSYENNIEIGQATITITGINNYIDSVVDYFQITSDYVQEIIAAIEGLDLGGIVDYRTADAATNLIYQFDQLSENEKALVPNSAQAKLEDAKGIIAEINHTYYDLHIEEIDGDDPYVDVVVSGSSLAWYARFNIAKYEYEGSVFNGYQDKLPNNVLLMLLFETNLIDTYHGGEYSPEGPVTVTFLGLYIDKRETYEAMGIAFKVAHMKSDGTIEYLTLSHADNNLAFTTENTMGQFGIVGEIAANTEDPTNNNNNNNSGGTTGDGTTNTDLNAALEKDDPDTGDRFPLYAVIILVAAMLILGVALFIRKRYGREKNV